MESIRLDPTLLYLDCEKSSILGENGKTCLPSAKSQPSNRVAADMIAPLNKLMGIKWNTFARLAFTIAASAARGTE